MDVDRALCHVSLENCCKTNMHGDSSLSEFRQLACHSKWNPNEDRGGNGTCFGTLKLTMFVKYCNYPHLLKKEDIGEGTLTKMQLCLYAFQGYPHLSWYEFLKSTEFWSTVNGVISAAWHVMHQQNVLVVYILMTSMCTVAVWLGASWHNYCNWLNTLK